MKYGHDLSGKIHTKYAQGCTMYPIMQGMHDASMHEVCSVIRRSAVDCLFLTLLLPFGSLPPTSILCNQFGIFAKKKQKWFYAADWYLAALLNYHSGLLKSIIWQQKTFLLCRRQESQEWLNHLKNHIVVEKMLFVTQWTHPIVFSRAASRHLAELLNHMPLTGDYHLRTT